MATANDDSNAEISRFLASDIPSVHSASLSELLIKGSHDMLWLVQALNSHLTNSDPYKRAKAIDLLISVIPLCKITETCANVILTFLTERLYDNTSVPYIVHGLPLIIPLASIDSSLAIPERIFNELNVQSFPQNVRFDIFKSFDLILSRLAGTISDNGIANSNVLGPDFVLGFLHIMEGEKDPRNLLLVFKIVFDIILHLPFHDHAEEICDLIFCYFPISFRPPPNDPYGITAEDLKLALRKCIAGSPLFSEYSLPLLMEKLSSSIGSAKKDAMETMMECVRTYDPTVFLSISFKLWDYLKDEIVKPSNSPNDSIAINTLTSITRALSAVTVSSPNSLEPYLDMIMKDVLHSLEDSAHAFVIPSENIYLAICSASMRACNYIVHNYISNIFQLLNSEPNLNRKNTILSFLVQTVKACRVLWKQNETSKNPLINLKNQFVDAFIVTLVSSEETDPIIITCSQGIFELIMTSDLLSATEMNEFAQHIHQVMISKIGSNSSKDCAQNLLKEISIQNENLVLQNSIVPLLDSFYNNDASVATFIQILSVPDSLYDHVINSLVLKLDQVIDHFEIQRILKVILEIIQNRSLYELSKKESKNLIQGKSLLIFNYFNKIDFDFGTELLQIIERIAISLMRHLDFKSQQSLIDKIFLNISNERLSSNFIIYLCAILGYCFKEIKLPVDSIEAFISTIVDTHLYSSKDNYSAKIISTLVNKNLNELSIPWVLEQVSILKTTIEDVSKSETKRHIALILYSWIAKALVIKASPEVPSFLNSIFVWLNDPILGKYAAESVKIIITDSENGYLTKLSFCQVNLLFKQKFFNQCLPQLVSGFSSCSTENQSNYLLTMFHLLRNVPKQILTSEAPQLFPLVLRALSFNDSELKIATLDILLVLMTESSLITEHISTIVPLILKMTILDDETTNPLMLRSQACLIMGKIADCIEYSIVHPYKSVIIKQLAFACNDHKRIVRKEAANSRNKWFLKAAK